jgi:hypothetical protein
MTHSEKRKRKMTRYKDFGSGDKSVKEPLSFKLHGEEFNCVPQVQGKLLLDLVSRAGGDDPAKAAGVIELFFSNVLEDESYTRFQALLDDKHRIVSVDTIGEITGWLVEEYSDRPTEGSEVS